ncbi:MAG: hypothetical protein U0169_05955 [Polyangiaceae bacterium]
MIVVAPGKLLLTGAYAVLHGAPALVCAVDRHAVAEVGTVDPCPSREIRAAFELVPAPKVDVGQLFDRDQKLGLGSSAASLVAALGASAVAAGKDLLVEDTRQALFDRARLAHRKAQGGGSGVDIAASVHGGVLTYALAGESTRIGRTKLPEGLVLTVYYTGTSVRTSEMRGSVDAFRSLDPSRYAKLEDEIATASEDAIRATTTGDLESFLEALRVTGDVLAELGDAADAPVVPRWAEPLVAAAADSGAAFVPSGAGGGDVFVHAGSRAPDARFLEILSASHLRPVALGIDAEGVRVGPTLPKSRDRAIASSVLEGKR